VTLNNIEHQVGTALAALSHSGSMNRLVVFGEIAFVDGVSTASSPAPGAVLRLRTTHNAICAVAETVSQLVGI
jgi:hypothetical protein